MKLFVLAFLVTTLLQAQTITIAVAANVSYAIKELKTAFLKTHPDTHVQVILGSSGKLTAQIKNGAPYGLFMSANMKYPEALYADKIALNSPVVYAKGGLAFLSVTPRDFSQGMALLNSKNIRKIAVANPKTAPYGVATMTALKNAKLYDVLKKKFIYGESISQTVSYAVVAADIGIIAKASLFSAKMKKYQEGVHWKTVDTQFYTPISQGIVLLQKSQKSSEYQAFYDFILSPEAKIIFKKYGYLVS